MRKSLGTIGALASLCTTSQTARGAVVVSTSIDNIEIVSTTGNPGIPITRNFDFDDDLVDDFVIFSDGSNPDLMISGLNGRTISVNSGTSQVKPYVLGDVITSFLTSEATTNLFLHDSADPGSSLIREEFTFFAVRYPGPSGYVTAFVQLKTQLNDGAGGTYDESLDQVVVAMSQWQSDPNGSITVVPEPSSLLITITCLASLGLTVRRRGC